MAAMYLSPKLSENCITQLALHLQLVLKHDELG